MALTKVTNAMLLTPPTNLVVQSKTAAYTVLSTDDIITCNANSAAFTLTLFPVSGNAGKLLTFKKTDSTFNAVTIDANASETIEGALTFTLNTQNEVLVLYCDGANWLIKDRVIPNIEVAYTPTFLNTTNFTVTKATWARRGDKVKCTGFLTWTGTGSGGTFTITPPSGLTIDSAKVTFNGSNMFGFGTWQDTGIDNKMIMICYASSTQIQLVKEGNGVLTAAAFTINDTLSFNFEVPIVGWN